MKETYLIGRMTEKFITPLYLLWTNTLLPAEQKFPLSLVGRVMNYHVSPHWWGESRFCFNISMKLLNVLLRS